MSISRIEIDDFIYNNIINEVKRGIIELRINLSVLSSDIKISMPNWFMPIVRSYSYFMYASDIKYEQVFFGVNLIPHYRNEIVVFYENFRAGSDNHYYVISLEKYIKTKPIKHIRKL